MAKAIRLAALPSFRSVPAEPVNENRICDCVLRVRDRLQITTLVTHPPPMAPNYQQPLYANSSADGIKAQKFSLENIGFDFI